MGSVVGREVVFKRLYYFDNIKCLLIFLVVIGHILDVTVVSDHRMAKAAFVFIYSFHMPLFIFVAGLFTRVEKLTREKALYKVCYFVILGFAAKIIELIVPAIYAIPISFSLLADSSLPWYMFAIAAYYTMAFLLKQFDMRIILAVSMVLGLFVGYDSSIGDFLYLSRIIVFFPFFWLGVMLEPEHVESVAKKVPLRIIGITAIVLFASVCILRTSDAYAYRGLFTGRNSFETVSSAIVGCSWLNRLIAYFVSAATGIGVLCIIPHSKYPVFTTVGTRTLQIYLLHFPIILILKKTGVLACVVEFSGSSWLLLIPIAILIALALSCSLLQKPIALLGAILWKQECKS